MTPDRRLARTRWIAICAASLAVVAGFAAAAPFITNLFQRNNLAAFGVMPLGATLFLLAVCVANHRRQRRGREPFMSLPELLGAYVIILMGCWAATWGFVENQMPLLTSPWVFASPANGWIEHVIPHLPRWALGPSEEPYASGFYNGLPPGSATPWGLWVLPTLAWTLFTVTLALFCLGLSSLVGRQWIEHDRLTFPYAEVLLGTARGFVSDQRFWWGLGLAAIPSLWNAVQPLMPFLPKMSLILSGGDAGVEWFKGAWRVILVLNLPMLGVFYFVHRDILLSMIVFFFVLALEKYWLGLAGFKLAYTNVLGDEGILNWQIMGSLVMLVLFSLWSGRRALAAYLIQAWAGKDREAGWLSPRAGLTALAVGTLGITLWLVAIGLRSPLPLFSLLGSQALGFLGTTRLAAESGMDISWPIAPDVIAVAIGGTAILAPAGMVALALTKTWIAGGAMISLLTFSINAEKLRSQVKFPRGIVWVVLAAVAISTAVSMYATAWLSYERGANNYGNWMYQWAMRIPYDRATDAIRTEAVGVDPGRFGWLGLGMALMYGLITLRNHIVGWFLHPVGLVLAGMGIKAGTQGNQFVFTALLVWLVKTLVLKLGGVESYERLKPLFAGAVLGHFLPDLLALFLDIGSFALTGHRLE